MFEPTSRYSGLKVATISVGGADGARDVTYVVRRFVPSSQGMTTLARHTVVQSDRLDNVSARYLGDPLQFWRICDANGAMNPFDLTAVPGRILTVPVPQPAQAAPLQAQQALLALQASSGASGPTPSAAVAGA